MGCLVFKTSEVLTKRLVGSTPTSSAILRYLTVILILCQTRGLTYNLIMAKVSYVDHGVESILDVTRKQDGWIEICHNAVLS